MINLPLFKSTIKHNYKVFIIILAVLVMYFVIITQMFEPGAYESIETLLQALPSQLIDAMGLNVLEPSLLGYLAGYYYGFLIVVFPLLYSIIVANRLIAKHVDRGSMAYLLATPNTRIKICLTQALFLVLSVTLLIASLAAIGILTCQALFPGELDISRFLFLNFGALLLHWMLSGIGFLASCLFNDTKNSLGFGAGIPIFFVIVQMLMNASDKLKGLKYVTLLSLFDPEGIISGGRVWPAFFAMFVFAAVFYGAAVYIFNSKDLPI